MTVNVVDVQIERAKQAFIIDDGLTEDEYGDNNYPILVVITNDDRLEIGTEGVPEELLEEDDAGIILSEEEGIALRDVLIKLYPL